MKKKINFFDGLKLNIKFTVIIIAFVMICMTILSGMLFYTMEQNLIRQQKNSVTSWMEQTQGQIIKNVESINMSSQFFIGDTQLQDFLYRTHEGDSFTTDEIVQFYQKEINLLERMVNNNPYLYQIRVYANNDNVQEMMPILYKKTRMKRLSWAADKNLSGWKFNYIDQIFDQEGLTQQKHIMALITEMKDYKNNTIGILETAMDMETMFPELYTPQANRFVCFIDENGKKYIGDGQKNIFSKNIDVFLKDKKKQSVRYFKEADTKIIIGYLPLKELNGALLCVQDITNDMHQVEQMRILFVGILLLVLVVLGFVINWIVRRVLCKFYEILTSIRQIQKGDLDVMIKDCGTDEMGELGMQINKMMERIRQLMQENIQRELLAKDFELRALQNQINAHFIYNVLESIKMMAEIEEKYEISDAVTALGKLLRYNMKWGTGNVTVREELEYIQNYLSLINLRFDYEIFLSVQMPEEIMIQEIPKMSLQPIVENAIIHGIEQLAENTTISIKGTLNNEVCMIAITDAGKGMSENELTILKQRIAGEVTVQATSGHGIGLKNVQERLHVNFGDAYGIELASKLGCYTKVTVKIPRKRIKVS